MSKFIDSLVKIVRMPERIDFSRTEVQVSKNIGIAPDGTLRAMGTPATLLRQLKPSQQSKDNTCPNCRHKRMVTGIYETLCYVHGSGQQEDKPTKCRNCSDARLCDKHHEELYTDSKPEKPHEHQWHDYPNGTFCLDCGRVKLPEDEPSKPEKPNLEPYLDAIYLVGESSNDVNNLALIQAIKDLAEKVEALLATEYDRGKVDAFKSIYAQATTTEWPRTYEAWHDQLKRVIEAELKGENHESGE